MTGSGSGNFLLLVRDAGLPVYPGIFHRPRLIGEQGHVLYKVPERSCDISDREHPAALVRVIPCQYVHFSRIGNHPGTIVYGKRIAALIEFPRFYRE